MYGWIGGSWYLHDTLHCGDRPVYYKANSWGEYSYFSYTGWDSAGWMIQGDLVSGLQVQSVHTVL